MAGIVYNIIGNEMTIGVLCSIPGPMFSYLTIESAKRYLSECQRNPNCDIQKCMHFYYQRLHERLTSVGILDDRAWGNLQIVLDKMREHEAMKIGGLNPLF
jgi:hypothetical protein